MSSRPTRSTGLTVEAAEQLIGVHDVELGGERGPIEPRRQRLTSASQRPQDDLTADSGLVQATGSQLTSLAGHRHGVNHM